MMVGGLSEMRENEMVVVLMICLTDNSKSITRVQTKLPENQKVIIDKSVRFFCDASKVRITTKPK